MILPIVAYGHPILKKVGSIIDNNYPEISSLIENMWETMYNAKGVGLAAPQIGLSVRLFIVDTIQIEKEGSEFTGMKKVFINPQLLEETGKEWSYEEGCLSIPNIHGDVIRLDQVRLKYFDEAFIEHTESFDGINARVIQHEYDHIEGKLFIEKLNPLKRRLIQKKLESIKKGKVEADYRLKFYS
jgi:peptide deformylase